MKRPIRKNPIVRRQTIGDKLLKRLLRQAYV
jgi:hypothetical protein